MKKTVLGILVAGIVFTACAPLAGGQIYVMSSIDALPNGGGIRAICQTKAVDAPNLAGAQTKYAYYQFGARCVVNTPNGNLSCPNEQDGNPLGQCDWTFPIQPGYPYLIQGTHIIWFYTMVAVGIPGSCSYGESPDSKPCAVPGWPYADYQAYTTIPAVSGQGGHLIDQRTLPLPTNSANLRLIPVYSPSYTLPVNTSAYFQAIGLTPTKASLYQTQQVSLSSNLDDSDYSVGWCLANEPSFSPLAGCSAALGQGTLDPTVGASVTYTAPKSIVATSPRAYICAQDNNDVGNHVCAEMDLTQLSIALTYFGSASVTLVPYQTIRMGNNTENGNSGLFTASIIAGASNLPASAVTVNSVTWGEQGNNVPWTLASVSGSEGTVVGEGPSVSGNTTSTSELYTTSVSGGQDLLTANAQVDLTANGTVEGDAHAQLSFPVTISSYPNKSPQTLTFLPIGATLINQQFSLSATAICQMTPPQQLLPPGVLFNSLTPDICSTNGNQLTTLSENGTCIVQATQPGDQDCDPVSATQSFQVMNYPPPIKEVEPFPLDPGNIFPDQPIFPPTDIFKSTPPTMILQASFTAPVTLGSIVVATQGAAGLDFTDSGTGTCTANTSFNAGTGCTVAVAFNPTASGTRYGAVVLKDTNGNLLARDYLQGSGVGPQLNFFPGTESVVPTSTLLSPSGIGVDGNGNIYLADLGNNQVLKETLSQGSYSESAIPSSNFTSPEGIAVDGSGIVYVANPNSGSILMEIQNANNYLEYALPTSAPYNAFGVAVDGTGSVYFVGGDNRLVKETLAAGSYTETVVATSPLQNPQGIAVDGSGNLYIADTGNNRILKETLSAGAFSESIISTSTLAGPQSVAVDAIGDIYIADTGNNRVLKETPGGNGYAETVLQTSTLSSPSGLAVDGAGNLYIANTGNKRILKEDFADPPSLTFATTAAGSTSSDSPQVITVENVGNGTLTFPVLNSGNNPSIGSDFTLNSSGPSACPLISSGASSSGTLSPGQSCQLVISFTPTTTGPMTESLVLTDNTLNAQPPNYSAQNVALNGIGGDNTPQTIDFASLLPQPANSSMGLSAAASSGLAVTFSSMTPAVCVISGTVVSFIAAGTCTIQASQAGNNVYSAAPTVSQSLTVTPLSQTITFPQLSTQYNNSTIGLNASATSGLPVSFTSTSPTVCTISQSVNVVTVTTGTCTIEANQSGNAVYSAASTVTQSFSVLANSFPGSGGSFGIVPVGSTSGAIPVAFTFVTAFTLGSKAVLTLGTPGLDFIDAGIGSCTVGTSYNAGDSCTVNVTFTPQLAGTRSGAAVLYDNTGNIASTVFLQGLGQGPQVIFSSGSQSTISSSGFSSPQQLAMDGFGNLYFAAAGPPGQSNYNVFKAILQPDGSYNQTVLTVGTQYPSGVAVDGAGDVYVLDATNNLVLKETPSSNGTYVESTVSTSALNSPESVAVDGSGNIYIADTYNYRVLKETLSSVGYTESVVVNSTSGVMFPSAISVDGNGNVYVADISYGQVFKASPQGAGYVVSTIGNGLNQPYGIEADSVGNVYVADSFNERVVKETLQSGSYVQSTLPFNGLIFPWGIAVNGKGDIFVVDHSANYLLKLDLTDSPSLSFAVTSQDVASSDSPQVVSIQNGGNMPLVFSSVSYPQDFPEAQNSSQDCSGASNLPAGGICSLSVDFFPSVPIISENPRIFNENVTVTTNALNASGTVASISVTGQEMEAQPLVVLSTSNSAGVTGSPVTFTATVSPSASTPFVPTGAVTFYSGATLLGAETLNNAGVGTYTVASLPPGGYVITATYSGDTIFPAATSSPLTQTISLPVSLAAPAGSNMGAVSIGSSSSPISLTITFNQAETLGSITVLTQGASNQDFVNAGGGTCTSGTSYAVNSTCSINVIFQPQHPGTRYGGVVLRDGSGNVLGTGYLWGTGQGTGLGTLSSTPTSLVSGFSSVNDVAIDGLGNLFVADNCTNVYEETRASDGSYTQSLFASGFSCASAVAVDGVGNIYVVDNGAALVYRETALPNGSVVQSVVASGPSPYSVAVDGSGNVFVADASGTVYEAALQSSGGYVTNTVGAGYGVPWAIAVDSSDNIYIADLLGSVYEEQLQSGGIYTKVSISQTMTLPWGVAVDGMANVYISGYSSTGDATLLLETPQSPGTFTETPIYIPNSNVLGFATNLSVDGNGDIFVGDFNTETVYEFVNSGTQ